MEILIIALLIILASVLFIAEIFFIPGISIAGILAICSLISANFYAFITLGTTGGYITLVCSLAICIGVIVYVLRSKALDRVALKEEIDKSIDNSEAASIKMGDQGITTTRLTLIGQADFNGKLIEVTSADGFIDEKTPIIVSRISQGTIYVRKS